MDEQEQVNRQVVLENAIQKAIDGGWKGIGEYSSVALLTQTDTNVDVLSFIYDEDDYTYRQFQLPVMCVIFSHDFAKALWGEDNYVELFNKGGFPTPEKMMEYNAGWQYHLQNMVISDDPIAYLGANI